MDVAKVGGRYPVSMVAKRSCDTEEVLIFGHLFIQKHLPFSKAHARMNFNPLYLSSQSAMGGDFLRRNSSGTLSSSPSAAYIVGVNCPKNIDTVECKVIFVRKVNNNLNHWHLSVRFTGFDALIIPRHHILIIRANEGNMGRNMRQMPHTTHQAAQNIYLGERRFWCW